MDVQRALRTMIRRLGSQAALARALGLSDQTIKEVLQGRRELGAPSREALTVLLNGDEGDG